MNMLFLHYAEIKTRGVCLKFFVNDVPLIECTTVRSRRLTYPISGWFRNDGNRLKVVISDALAVADASVIVRRVAVGDPSDEGEVGWHFSWSSVAEEEGSKPPFFEENSYLVKLDDVRARLSKDAEQIAPLSNRDIQEIRVLVSRFRELNIRRNWAEMLELLSYRIEDEARVEGHTSEHLKAVYYEQFETLLPAGQIEIAPLNWEHARLYAGFSNQVVGVAPGAIATEPILVGRVVGQNSMFQVRIFVSRIAGEWRFVRGF